jgi:sortase A
MTTNCVCERGCLAIGGILLAIYVSAHLDRVVSSRSALQQFDAAQRGAQTGTPPKPMGTSGEDIDFSLWSEERIGAFKASLSLRKEEPLAVLAIERLSIRVPVFEGTDDLTLNRGAGWIVGTAEPGTDGNTGIAAHRDGFFRALKDVQTGDAIELRTHDLTLIYRVSATRIVDPEDVGVLAPRAEPSVTLVTCYPFYFAGSAPQRFIVHAALQHQRATTR